MHCDYVNVYVCAYAQTLGCRPVASLDHFLPEHLGNAGLVEEVPMGTSKVVKVSVYCSLCVLRVNMNSCLLV